MIQLALETSTKNGSVCLLDGTRMVDQRCLEGRPATRILLPIIQSLLSDADLATNDIEKVSISIGPGSFTGLRMGVSTAKTLAWAIGCQVVPVSTHQILCERARRWMEQQEAGYSQNPAQIVTLIDAQRGQWFAQTHQLQENRFEPKTESAVVDPLPFVSGIQHPTLVSGTGLVRHADQVDWPETVVLAERAVWAADAATLGMMVAANPDRYQSIDPLDLLPEYGRRSAAEEKLQVPS